MSWDSNWILEVRGKEEITEYLICVINAEMQCFPNKNVLQHNKTPKHAAKGDSPSPTILEQMSYH